MGWMLIAGTRGDVCLSSRHQYPASARRRSSLTFIQGSRVDDNDAELLPMSLRLEKYSLDDGRPRVRQDRLAVLDLGDGMLLDDLVGQQDPIPNERIDLCQQECFGLSKGSARSSRHGWSERTSSTFISISISEISYLRYLIAVPIETERGRARMRWLIWGLRCVVGR